MSSKAAIQEFYALKTLAVGGVSRNPQKFGHMVYKDLKTKGYTVYPVNPQAESIDGEPCYPSLDKLPTRPDGVVIVTPPAQSEQLVRQAIQAGITRVWLQQGSESPAVLQLCQQNGINTISGECIFMYTPHTNWLHGIHRVVNSLIGKAPK